MTIYRFIVDFLMKNGGSFQFVMQTFTRGYGISPVVAYKNPRWLFSGEACGLLQGLCRLDASHLGQKEAMQRCDARWFQKGKVWENWLLIQKGIEDDYMFLDRLGLVVWIMAGLCSISYMRCHPFH
jgi:hypothetical protein